MFSSIHQQMRDFLKRSDFDAVIHNHCKNQFLAWVGLFSETVGAEKRFKPILIWSLDHDAKEKVSKEVIFAVPLY